MTSSWSALADVGERGVHRLPSRAVTYRNVRSVVDTVMTVVIAAVLTVFFLPERWRTAALVTLAALFMISVPLETAVLEVMRVRNTSYTATPEFVYLTKGVIFRTSVLIPGHQILAVETVEGPLLRKFGFVTVRFRCLTTSEELGPLNAAAVSELRRAVLQAQPESDRVRDRG